MVNRVVDKTEHAAHNDAPEERKSWSIADWFLGAGFGFCSTAAILFTFAIEIPDHALSAPAYFATMTATFTLGFGWVLKSDETGARVAKKDGSTYKKIRV